MINYLKRTSVAAIIALSTIAYIPLSANELNVRSDTISVSESHTNEAIVAERNNNHNAEEHQSHGLNLAPLLFIVLSLFIGTATRHLFSRGPLPYTILLLIFGLLFGILTRLEIFSSNGLNLIGQSIEWAGNIDPHLILYLFLPTLIFEAAYALHLHTFKKSLGNAIILAVPGIMVAIIITAFFVLLIKAMGIGLNEWTLLMALLFGSIISATDPVAVVAILKEVGASKRLSTITESESMLNDGTAIVFFMTIFGLITGEASGENALIEFLRVALGGVLIGAAIGWAIISWLKRVFNDALIEITVVIGAAYLSFFLAESVFHVSGVIAVVTLGISMAGPGKTRISPGVSHFLHEFWELAAFIANTLIFIVVGVVIAQQVSYTLNDLFVLILIYIALHIARLGTIYVFYPIMQKIGYGITFKDSIVLWWGGLRGAVALALALIVAIDPRMPFDVRNQLLSLTAGVVVLTSLINATTVRWLIDKLGLSKIGDIKVGLLMQSLQQIRLSGEKEIEKLKGGRYMSGADWNRVQSFLLNVDAIEQKPQSFDMQEAVAETRKRLLQKEKESYWRQFSEGLLSSDGVHLLSDRIDTLLDYGGKIPLSQRQDIENLWKTTKTIAVLQNLPLVGVLWKKRFINRLTISYDCARAFVVAQDECIKSLSSLIIGFSLGESGGTNETEILSTLEDEIHENRITGQTFLRNLKVKYPDICRNIETLLASRTLLNEQEEMLNRLKRQGRLEPDESERIAAQIHASMKLLMDKSMIKEEASSKIAEIISSITGLSGLTREQLQAIISESQTKIYPADSIIARQGTNPDSIFIILNGTVNIYNDNKLIGVKEIANVFGSYEWLAKSGFFYTYKAETPVTLVKIGGTTINSLLSKYPETSKYFTFAAAADMAMILLKQHEHYAELSPKKLKTIINNASLHIIKANEKQRYTGSLCLLILGNAISDEQDKPIKAPAILNDCNIRSNGEAIVLVLS